MCRYLVDVFVSGADVFGDCRGAVSGVEMSTEAAYWERYLPIKILSGVCHRRIGDSETR